MKIAFFITFLLIVCNSNYAQQQHAQPQAQYITTIPFKQIMGGVILVKAALFNSNDSLQFILDTGSGGISIDSSTCVEHNILINSSNKSISGIGGKSTVSFTSTTSICFPNLKLPSMPFHVYNYSQLSSIYGEKIDGVIGYAFFSKYIIKINFDRSLLMVYSPGKIKYPFKGNLLHVKIQPLPLHAVSFKMRKKTQFNFFLDTGAGLPLLLSNQLVTDSNILSANQKTFTTQAEGLGGKKQMQLTVLKEVKMGPYKFKQVPTYLFKDDLNVIAYPLSGGLIGNEILRRFNLIINYPQNEIHLSPNLYFDAPFEYGYAGLTIALLNDRIVVEDVIAGSPAAVAGFQIGDEMISVDNQFSGNLQQYKNLLQEPDKIIKSIINRAGILIELEMKTICIL